MPRDKEKYLYPNPRFDRSSEVYQKLMEEARYTGMSISDLIVMRVAHSYKVEAGQVSIVPAQSESGEPTFVNDTQANAYAAAQAWSEDED